MDPCEVCGRDMKKARSCIEGTFYFNHQGSVATMRAIPYFGIGKCKDCGVSPRGYHHAGCDRELCPRCATTVSGCDCPLATLEQLEEMAS